MVSLEIRSVGPGTCSWCGKEKNEVCTVVFNDGSIEGPMDYCPSDFWRAMRAKARGAAKKLEDRSTPAADAAA